MSVYVMQASADIGGLAKSLPSKIWNPEAWFDEMPQDRPILHAHYELHSALDAKHRARRDANRSI